MSEEKVKMLATTVQKLMSRGARPNVIKILEKSHAADIAELLSVLSHEDRYDVFLMEPNEEKRAEILSHLEEEQQAEMLKVLSKKDVITLVSRMEKDDVADLLGSIPEDEADEILSSMVKNLALVAVFMGAPLFFSEDFNLIGIVLIGVFFSLVNLVPLIICSNLENALEEEVRYPLASSNHWSQSSLSQAVIRFGRHIAFPITQELTY